MKLFFKISGLAIILIVTGVTIFIWTLDIDQYKPVLEQTISEKTGREFRINGEISIAPSLSPLLTVNGISLANADWASEEAMLSAEQVEARVSLLPLLSGALHINSFTLHNTRIILERNRDGIGNWELETQIAGDEITAPSPETAAPLPPISIDTIDIQNARIIYRDLQDGTSTDFNISEFSTSVSNLDLPLNIHIAASYDDIPLILDGTVGPISVLLADESYSVDLMGGFSALEFSLKGDIANPMQVQGANLSFSGQLESLEALNELAGTSLPDLKPFNFSGNMKFENLERINIDTFKFQLGQSDISGDISFSSASSTPMLTARLQSDRLDLTPFANEEEQAKPEFLFARDELPLAGLSEINADISLVSKLFILTPTTHLDNSEFSLKLQNGNLQTSTASGMAGGRITALIGIQTSNDVATLKTDISGNNIMLERLPHKQQEWFTGGPVELSVNGSGQGKSIAEIMGSFSGKFLLQVGEGTMPNRGVDMVGADLLLNVFNRFNPFADQEQISILECAVINLDIRDGLITIDRQIAMQTAKMNMVGSGQINLKTEQIDLGIKPYAREGIGLNLSAISGVARIGGTLANPTPEIDPKGTLTAGVTAGAALATGGLSLLAQGLFSRTTDDQTPCNTALGQTAAAQNQSQPVTEAPAEQENTEGLLDNVRGGIRNLFGR